MNPKIDYKPPFQQKVCARCHQSYDSSHFMKTKSFFFDGYVPICNDCVEEYLKSNNFSWDCLDKLCQSLDIPWIPSEYERLKEQHGDTAFSTYASIFSETEYENLTWGDYFEEFKKLQAAGVIIDELPLLQDKRRQELKEKWGFNYDDEELHYLESLYDGLLLTQNITGALQIDQAKKLCKISCELDNRIREGAEIDKMIASYDKLVKTAEFTPKNVKSAADFDSIGELIKWLEKRGFRNSYYDNVTRDIVDETMKDIQAGNRRLYTNESNIGEEITNRIESLKNINEMENYYNINQEQDLDAFEAEGYDNLMKEETEEFIVDLEED